MYFWTFSFTTYVTNYVVSLDAEENVYGSVALRMNSEVTGSTKALWVLISLNIHPTFAGLNVPVLCIVG